MFRGLHLLTPKPRGLLPGEGNSGCWLKAWSKSSDPEPSFQHHCMEPLFMKQTLNIWESEETVLFLIPEYCDRHW